MSAFGAVFARETRLAFAGGGGAAGPAVFFIAALTLAPLAIGPDMATLAGAGPGLICFAALLAALQPAERLYGDDLEDGTLDLYALAPSSLASLVLAKTAGQALATLAPILPLGFLAGLMFGLAPHVAGATMIALAAALPGLALFAAFAGALCAGLKRAGLLIALIAAPLQTPLLIFAAGAGRSAAADDGRTLSITLLVAAISLGATALLPFAIAGAVRSRLD